MANQQDIVAQLAKLIAYPRQTPGGV